MPRSASLPLRMAYWLQKRLWRLVRPRTRGVKVMLFNAAGELLLIRNSYGRSELFVLPGGGIRPFETPEAAARRELREELGCVLEKVKPIGTYASTGEGKRDTVFLFEALATGEPRLDEFEVIEARYCALNDLPPSVSSATTRRIAEFQGKQPRSDSW